MIEKSVFAAMSWPGPGLVIILEIMFVLAGISPITVGLLVSTQRVGDAFELTDSVT